MAVPTINATQSILAATVGQQLSFQPAASDTPTSWALSSGGLPTGVELNTTTGKVSGVPTEAGAFAFGLKATNGTGTSAEVIFCMGIERIAFAADSSLELDIDLVTGHVTNPGDPSGYPLYLKIGDRVRLSIGYTKGGVLQDLPIALITVGLREYGEEQTMLLNAGNAVKVGDYESTRYQVLLELDDAILRKQLNAILSNNQQDAGPWFVGSTEIEWIEAAEVYLGAGEEDLRRTTRTFMSMIVGDMFDNLAPIPVE